MRFGRVAIDEAEGALAAHTVRVGGVSVRKGTLISREVAAELKAAGLADVIAARLDDGDMGEDEAALLLATAVAGGGTRVERPFTGRSNLFATSSGVLLVEAATIDAINGIDEAVTLATLLAYKPVVEGEMIATVKIIPYAVARSTLEMALSAAAGPAPIRVAPYVRQKVGVISTITASLKPSVTAKTIAVLKDRLRPAAAGIVAEADCPHDTDALAPELTRQAAGEAELIIVFGASAIADRRDVIPAAIEAAGGTIEHFGIPVDPGNLLLLGTIRGKPVIGAPGCARSPKENGFDWVLQRLLTGLEVTRAEITRLGVGGLLMEIVSRGQPREGGEPSTSDAADE